MVISTFGTKICDDALGYSGGKIVNRNRLVEISPFTIHEKFNGGIRKIKEELPFSYDNEYLLSILNREYRKEIPEDLKNPEAGIVVIDMLICRLYFREFVFEDGTLFRITESAAAAKNMEYIRKELEAERGVKIKSEKLYNPLRMSDSELEAEIKLFAQVLTESVGMERLVLLKMHNAVQYINKANQIDILPNVGKISEFNEFYDKCTAIFEKYVQCKIIEMPEYVIGDEKIKAANSFHYTFNYYQYILECLYSIEQKSYSESKSRQILDMHNVKEKMYVEETLLRPLIDLTKLRAKGRKIILVGKSEVYEYNLRKKYGMSVCKRVEYDKDATMESVMEQLEDVKYKYKEYVIVIPNVYPKNKVLEAAWRCGYAMNRDCLYNFHPIYKLNNFVGRYKDIYNNEITSKKCVTIELRGVASSIDIGASSDTAFMSMVVFSQTDITIGQGLKLEKEGMNSLFYDGASVLIGDNVKLCSRVHIRNSFFNSLTIGNEAVVCEDTVFMNGDGHAILDLNTGKNINYDLNNSRAEKHRIVIGNNVYIGIGAFILSGTVLGEGCVVRDRAFVNKKFENDCIIGGQPAGIIG